MVSRSIAGYLAAIYVMSLSTNLAQVEGRKCVCTSKACKEAGLDTCRTKFFCYTEVILVGQEINESTTTRGCTEGGTPLLCATKSWIPRSQSVNVIEPSINSWAHWPKLICCNNHDYCNADQYMNVSTWMRERQTIDQALSSVDLETSDGAATNRNMLMTQPDQKYQDKGLTDLFQHRVRSLYIAAFILTIAAFISVLAACYVITRFLRGNLYVINNVN